MCAPEGVQHIYITTGRILRRFGVLVIYIPHPCAVWRRVVSRIMNTRDRDKLHPSMRHAIGLSCPRNEFNWLATVESIDGRHPGGPIRRGIDESV